MSRGGRDGRAAVNFVVYLGAAGFFLLFWYLHFQIRARVRDRWLPEIQSSQRRLGEGATTTSQPAHGELAPTYPHQLYYLFCSHLRNMAS